MFGFDSFKGNPKWVEVKKPARCTECHTVVARGQYAFAYPRTRTLYCERKCGWQAELDYEHCAA